MIKRKLDWVRSTKPRPAHRKMFRAHKAIPIPPVIDLSPYEMPIWDQGQWGACTGNGIAALHDSLRLKVLRDNQPDKTMEELRAVCFPSSRLFIYNGERDIEGDLDQDAGASIPDGIDLICARGVCPEKYWPYIAANMFVKPNAQAYAVAATHKNVNPYDIDSPAALDQCLASGYEVVCGFTVPKSFMEDTMANTGRMPTDEWINDSDDGHCVVIAGRNTQTGEYKLRNSWGTDWGDNGYFYAPIEVVNSNLFDEFATLRL